MNEGKCLHVMHKGMLFSTRNKLLQIKKKGNSPVGKWSTWTAREFNFLKELQTTLKTM